MQFASEDFDAQMHSLVAEHPGAERQAGCWEWQMVPFSPAVRWLKPIAGVPDVGLLGKGTTAEVH